MRTSDSPDGAKGNDSEGFSRKEKIALDVGLSVALASLILGCLAYIQARKVAKRAKNGGEQQKNNIRLEELLGHNAREQR